MRVSHFMEAALGHPDFGYYRAHEPFGRAGDFITAPEISQMFGELLGAWLAAHWRVMCSLSPASAPVRVCELGPGRGVLMADALRAARAQPGFIDAASLYLIETSPRLRAVQAEALAGAGADKNRIHWARDVSQVPPGPLLLLANEFFDALPIRQFMLSPQGWRERRVALGGAPKNHVDNAGELAFMWGDAQPAPPAALPPALCAAAAARPGEMVEVSPAALRAVHTIAARLAVHGGAALIIDYGHARSGAGETLQAVRAHAFQHPLSRPGETDLTAHVDFQALAETATGAGARVYGPVGQGAFLESLGISARAAALAKGATPEQRAEIASAHARLTGAGEGQMGALFKVLCLTGPDDPPPPGFGPA
ncbi:MAG: class I SAM-dependent methyltransferase [Rhodospirillales bacterium]